MAEERAVVRQMVPSRGGFAFSVRRGQRFRITDLEGQQVSDLVVFSTDDLTERLSQGNTRKLNNTWLLSTGHRLYSTKCRPLLTIVSDTVGRHDLQSSACSPYDYPIRFGITGHPSCLAILSSVLEEHRIPEHLIPDPFNVFMNTEVGENGQIEVRAPLSKPGDYIEFQADTDCLVAMTACPQDQNACNGYRITPLQVDVFPA
ncbi:MAG TPA: urea carboxylase-associated family protein [bacterium]|nr:urea carboxylase-associated family protein [bacterium]